MYYYISKAIIQEAQTVSSQIPSGFKSITHPSVLGLFSFCRPNGQKIRTVPTSRTMNKASPKENTIWEWKWSWLHPAPRNQTQDWRGRSRTHPLEPSGLLLLQPCSTSRTLTASSGCRELFAVTLCDPACNLGCFLSFPYRTANHALHPQDRSRKTSTRGCERYLLPHPILL